MSYKGYYECLHCQKISPREEFLSVVGGIKCPKCQQDFNHSNNDIIIYCEKHQREYGRMDSWGMLRNIERYKIKSGKLEEGCKVCLEENDTTKEPEQKLRCQHCEKYFTITRSGKDVDDFKNHYCDKLGGIYKDKNNNSPPNTTNKETKNPPTHLLVIGGICLVIGLIGLFWQLTKKTSHDSK